MADALNPSGSFGKSVTMQSDSDFVREAKRKNGRLRLCPRSQYERMDEEQSTLWLADDQSPPIINVLQCHLWKEVTATNFLDTICLPPPCCLVSLVNLQQDGRKREPTHFNGESGDDGMAMMAVTNGAHAYAY